MRFNYGAADGQSHTDPMRLRGKEAAAEVLTLIGEQGGDPMMAQLGMMLALNRRRPKPTPAPRRKPAKVYRFIRLSRRLDPPVAAQDCHSVQARGCSQTVGTMESTMSKAGLDNRHRNHDGEISHKHGNTIISTLRKIYGQSFAAGHPETKTLSEVLLQLNETSLSQLRRDHETGHLKQKIAKASK
jgi:hypothetical protein